MKNILILSFFVLFAANIFAQLPSVTLKTIDGKTINTDTLRNGDKPFIISFFALWCKPCLRELEEVSELYEEWQKETGVKIFAVSIDEAQNSQKVKPYINQKGWEYEILLDPNGDFDRAMNVNKYVPAVFIYDGNGNQVFSRKGFVEGSAENWIEKVREIVKN
ncbi:MAG: TlpA family protein disulfide reductase [Prevotellaceae bacterium]|nr:TlpA family protein disulfide reductase [Prevotellaceae bacterium]